MKHFVTLPAHNKYFDLSPKKIAYLPLQTKSKKLLAKTPFLTVLSSLHTLNKGILNYYNRSRAKGEGSEAAPVVNE